MINIGMDASAYQQERRLKAVMLFLCLSLLLHLTVLIVLKYFSPITAPPPPKAVFVDLNPPNAPKTVAEQPKQQPKQIVESEAAPNTVPPKEAKYLGERTQSVEQETRAKAVDSFRAGGKVSERGNHGKSLSFKDLAPTKPTFTPPTPKEMEGYREQQEKVAQEDNAKRGENQLDNLGSASNDYLKDTKDGDRTMLNTKEFVYFTYYRRIRQKLEVAWNSRLRNTMSSYIYGARKLANRDYVTGVVVVLDKSGNITRVQVLQQSGARDLDQAAVDAFNSAGPFPDPPSGLVDEKGEIQIPWNFILQTGGALEKAQDAFPA